LVKYVFDALSERLYSVNEMYRVITSYVYPGATITLPNFRNWWDWVQASGMLKYIGIRWGPGENIELVEEYLREIDIEEILEDEEDEGYEEEEYYEEEDPEEYAEPEEDDGPPGGVPDFDEEPVRSRPARSAEASQSRPAVSAPEASFEPMAAQRVALRLRAVAEIQEVQKVLELDPEAAEAAERSAALDEAELAQNLEGMTDLCKTSALSPLSLLDLRVAPSDFNKRAKGSKSFFLYRALVAGTAALRPYRGFVGNSGPSHTPESRFRVLDESGALSRHFEENQSLDLVIASLVQAGYGDRPDVLALAPAMALAKQACDDRDKWASDIGKKKKAEKVWEEVYQELHSGFFDLELIWLVRECARYELWAVEGLLDTAVVPTQDTLDAAFRVGLLPLPYCGDFAALLHASRTLTGFFGQDLGWEAGILHFASQTGCAYHCPNRFSCSYFCREKLRR
ncbi:MAG: hypothetical protein KC561_16570, partial [Myxococcales bacterium]|nr:hypothetical protein [Myxococcales bacterium]